jgi:signal peptidase I
MMKGLRGYAALIAEVMILIMLSYTFAFPYRVDGSSMEANYYTGDRVFISHISAWLGKISRGDAVVCNLGDMRVIKRVIAVPGDRLRIEDGKVYINDVALDEDYLTPDTYTGDDMSLLIGEDEYFVMGDNRGVSLDSRQEGCISYDDIKGKVIFKL